MGKNQRDGSNQGSYSMACCVLFLSRNKLRSKEQTSMKTIPGQMRAAYFRGDITNVFWSKICEANRDAGPASCWLWPGSPSTSGYGRLNVHGRSYQTHRIAYCLTHPEVVLTPDVQIIHLCNTKMCCRPCHLLAADAYTNMSQAARDGLLPTGERHSGAKLTDLTVADIIVRWLLGETPREIAPDYDVGRTAINNILAGRNWKRIATPLFQLLCPEGADAKRKAKVQRSIQHGGATHEA
jgi:hypothetical protein